MKTLAAFIIGLSLVTGVAKTQAQVGVQITVAPPLIPEYVQPPCPVEGYMWSPGYWAWGDDGYYWVPGVWVAAPEVGFLWTPGYWDFEGGYYGWHHGYWGEHVGYYGCINYGYGYGGHGFYGGRWEGGAFRYNTEVWHVNNSVIHNTYSERPAEGPTGSRAAFNGAGGASGGPTANERTAMSERHVDPSSEQRSHEQAMKSDKSQYASVNHGKPATAAMNSVHGDKFNNAGHAAGASPAAAHTSASHVAAHTSNQQHSAPQQHTATQQQHVQHTAATQQHAQHSTAPQQQQHVQHSATQQQHVQHSVPQQQHSQPQQHAQQQQRTAPQQQHSQPQREPQQQQHSAPQQQHSQPQGGHEGGGEGHR